VPIHDQGYRRYGGSRDALGRAWSVIAVTGVRSFIGRRMFLLLLVVAWGPFVIRAGQMYAAANFPSASFLAVTARTFRDFLDTQGWFVFFVTIYVGAGLIADDRRANALQIYLSKPLTRIEYIIGKLAILVVFLLLVTWVPAILLLVAQVLFAGSVTFLMSNLYLVPAITVFSFTQVMVASFSMLALSSLSRSSRFVAVMYAGLMFFSDAVADVVSSITGESSAAWISLTDNLAQVGDAIFRLPHRYDVPIVVSLAVVVALIGLAIVVLERRVRGVEVVV
jgi:ABC-type transport system involved in multi-copper enzyme maturation permease subunit